MPRMLDHLLFYYLSDELHSTRLVVNASGGIVFSSDYKPYGLLLNSTGLEGLSYTGQILDPTTGLYYYKARFYNPDIQRFLTEDTNQSSMITPGDNRYSYSNDNPETLVDPSGHNSIEGGTLGPFSTYVPGFDIWELTAGIVFYYIHFQYSYVATDYHYTTVIRTTNPKDTDLLYTTGILWPTVYLLTEFLNYALETTKVTWDVIYTPN